MPSYGPIGESPNPLQRLCGRSRLVASGFVGVFLGGVWTAIPLLVWGVPARVSVWIGAIGAVTTTILVHAFGRGRHLTPEQWSETVVPYMPWFGSRQHATNDEPPPGVPRLPRLLARGNLVRSVLRGAVLGAGVTAPFVPHVWIAGVASAAGALLGALAHRRYRRRQLSSKR